MARSHLIYYIISLYAIYRTKVEFHSTLDLYSIEKPILMDLFHRLYEIDQRIYQVISRPLLTSTVKHLFS